MAILTIALTVAGSKAARQRQGSRDGGQRAVNRSGQFERARGRFHGAVAAHEQRVIEQDSANGSAPC